MAEKHFTRTDRVGGWYNMEMKDGRSQNSKNILFSETHLSFGRSKGLKFY